MDIEEESLKGQADIWEHMFAFVDSMALKCAIELGIPDIINSHGRPTTMSEIIESLKTTTSSSSPSVDFLTRVMRLLVRKRIFTSHSHQESNQTLYDLTPSSKWLLKDSELNLSRLFLFETDPTLVTPWHYMGKCVQDGGLSFQKAHGCGIWDLTLANPQFNQLFNEGMACTAKMQVDYRNGFNGIGSLVDVGGGTGAIIAEIVKANPHIQGINFDLPHVVATAPEYPGISHVGGDMFAHIPEADAVIMKWIMHCWSDENCVKILRNCRKAISKTKNGKVIIVDCVLRPEGDGLFDETGLAFDLLMMVNTLGGKERTEIEWNILLKSAGFPRYNIIQLPTFPSIIEAFPE
ncbi:hypothetical protein C5167_000372 [Papaver somniferum]|uniref:Uncharacterized protein n=1 Tax=Papaver somniferum TaxID=3469 RepID=A0A4Y7KSS8_PAPSO|nr:(R,S)-reticuline 7-O-methyltransferase-like [Papaver somniferum]RZC75857.1 hypothetical protein C5167_000372 [Papaver somniferum]